jgi:hypothetical protein
MNEASLFFAAFITVFALGFQQQNVAGRHYVAAVFTSTAIGASQIFLWRLAPMEAWTEIAATLIGGPCGIVAAMYAHPRIARRWNRVKK